MRLRSHTATPPLTSMGTWGGSPWAATSAARAAGSPRTVTDS